MDVPADLRIPPSAPRPTPPSPPVRAAGPGSKLAVRGAHARPSATADAVALPPADLREAVIDVLLTIYDPEIPVNIYDLGLVYAVDVAPDERRDDPDDAHLARVSRGGVAAARGRAEGALRSPASAP